jgi:RNA polymerase-binding transcription factor DksA/ribosome-associated translation inhibitor RaiA
MQDGVTKRKDRPRGEGRRAKTDAGEAGNGPIIEVVALDEAARAVVRRAERKVRRVLHVAGAPVLHATVKLGLAPDPAVERPALAEVTLDINGQLVRAHVAAHTLREAVDLLEDRLRRRLEHRVAHVDALRRSGHMARSGGWRHGQPAGERPLWPDRAVEEREVARHKTFSVGEATVDEAAFDLEMLGHDFHLFRELATGLDAVLHRRSDGAYGLRRVRSSAEPVTAVVPVRLEPVTAPPLSLDDALEWLNCTGEAFLFFADPETGRAKVAYRRYDGHYGLITPVDEPAPPAEAATARRRLRAELERLEIVRDGLRAEGFDVEPEMARRGELTALHQNPADLGTETFGRERGPSLLADVDGEIADVHRALARVGRGTYGRCETCGATIPDDRLTAVPATRFCLEHQAGTEITPGLRH